MRADLGAIYDDTITIVNKLDARDAALKQDMYYTTVIPHCMWSVRATRQVQGDGTVAVGTTHQVQIPESENYMPYREWRKSDVRETAFTVRTGDYIILGEVPEQITASNIREIVKLYEPDAFQVQAFRDATKGAGFDHGAEGALRFAEVYYVEG